MGRVNHGDFHLSNIVADDDLLSPCLIDFAWTETDGHGLIDFTMMESSLRFMRFPRDVNPHLLLEVDRLLAESLATTPAIDRIRKVKDTKTRTKLDAMIRSVSVVRDCMQKAYPNTPAETLRLEYNRVLFAILSGQEKFDDFPILRAIINLDFLRREIGLS